MLSAHVFCPWSRSNILSINLSMLRVHAFQIHVREYKARPTPGLINAFPVPQSTVDFNFKPL